MGGDADQIAQRIDSSLSAVEDIFKTLVDISRMDAGRLEPDIDAVPLQELFEQLKVEFEPVAKAKGLRLRMLDSRAWVKTDEKLLRRILQNLIGNAIKYTPAGRVLVGVRQRAGKHEVQVWDTGPGIPADKQDEVFKEFKRLDETAGSARGIGLGLSIVERIGRILDHPIGLRSELGRGTCFSVTLPAAVATSRKSREGNATMAGPLTGARVLCIENEPVVLDGMTTLLSGWGCHVIGAASQEEALAALEQEGDRALDVIMADYHLDNGTGDAAIRTVRQYLASEVPGVIITADHTPDTQRRLRQDGFVVLRKPVKAGALRALIMQHSRRSIAAE